MYVATIRSRRSRNPIHHTNAEFPDIPIEIYDWGRDVNLKGQFCFDHAVMKQMREQKDGVILNIGSICGEEGALNAVAYATAKSGAMNGLTKSLTLYGRKYGIRCCCVSPGSVMTRPGMAGMKTAVLPPRKSKNKITETKTTKLPTQIPESRPAF